MAKAIIREDVQRGGRGRRGDQCCLVHATEGIRVERDAIRKASLLADLVRLNGAATHGLYTVNVFMLMMNSKARIVGRPNFVFVDTSVPRAKDSRMGLLAGVA